MAIPEQYLVTTKNLDGFFNSLLNAQAPQKFTLKFLEQLEFKSTNDRLFIGILKALNFIDNNGIPQEIYYKFLDQSESKSILANAIKECYSDLFAINIKANEMSVADVKNKLKTLTQGAKSNDVINWMANTFVSLCNYADFSKLDNKNLAKIIEQPYNTEEIENDKFEKPSEIINKNITTQMHYNIQIHLPETREIAVYDAIFKSLKEHLL